MDDTRPEPRTIDPPDRSGNGDRRRWVKRLSRLIGRMSNQGALEQERLEAAIQRLRVHLDVGSEEPVPDWLDRARRHLADATQRLADRQFSTGWTSLNAARRESVWGLDPACARLEAIRVYHESAEKLSSWREKSNMELLKLRDGEGGALEECEDLKARIVKAREILDERNDNMYRKLRLLRHQLGTAAFQLAVGLAALVVVVAAGWAEVPEDSLVVEDWHLLVAVITVGWVAAVVSSVVALGRRDAAEPVPSLRKRGLHMLLRPIGGSASAVLVVALVQTGLGGNVDVEGVAVYAVAISAGFTEFLITRAISNAQKQLRS